MTTVVRASEFIPLKSFTVDFTSPNYNNEIKCQLSSPLASYAMLSFSDEKVLLKHPKNYPERLKNTKQDLNGLRSEMNALRREFEQNHREDQRTFQQKIEETNRKVEQLEAEHKANKNLLLNWETKSRLVQALNDRHIFENHIIPKHIYASLKIEGCNYLPYLLSVWAVYFKDEVATCLGISRKQQDKCEAKAAKLIEKGLQGDVNSIWCSLPDDDRSLMIKLWLTRPDIRALMAHPTPTVEEGMNVIRADSQLSEAERRFITDFIPIAVDKAQNHLFA